MFNTPVSNRLHIGIFGRRNVGKSSLINALTGQDLAIVSDIAGTTTDPVYKTMEIFPIGPCVLIDTAGIDDVGALGEKRVEKTLGVLRKTDVALIIVDASDGIGVFEETFISLFSVKSIPYVIVINKADKGVSRDILGDIGGRGKEYVKVSALTGDGIEELKLRIIEKSPANWSPIPLVRDIIKEKDTVVMVCPIDSAMPQGRLILPQVQVLREILDAGAAAMVCKDSELKDVMAALKIRPSLVITDSQVFRDVKDMVGADVPLTSFSIIFARHKGDLQAFLDGISALKELEDGDEVLIAEACTHHVQPEDIGRSKIPTWIMEHSGKELEFDVTSGGDFPRELGKYKLIISCGGCMVNRREMLSRVEKARKAGVAITNYGILIAHLSGILQRTLAPFSGGAVQFKIDHSPVKM